MAIRSTFLAIMLATVTQSILAQPTSPYTELRAREIKALAPEQIRDLREARGMGLSLPAELNGAPGPLHVIELRQALAITDEQASEIERITVGMRARAKSLGEDIIRAEAALDQAFKNGTPDEAAVGALTERIGQLNGQLRAAHLNAHLQTKRVLTPVQLAAYDRARGYTETNVQPARESSGQHGGGSHRHH